MNRITIVLVCALIGTALLSVACAGTNKNLRKSKESTTENIIPKTAEMQISEPAITIKEVEEKLVPIDENLPDHHRYFVIIGSFRNQDNVMKYQGQILRKGFNSEVVKNEAGFYRVSVMSTDEKEIARDEIRRIRSVFAEHYDTWLLIQTK
jgi:cell division protein FtsN